MRTGIFGGTFNPVHNGHLRLARTYRAELGLDRLLVIPTRTPPHKSGEGLIDGRHRLEMCRLAFEKEPGCEVSDIELSHDRKSYTVDTLEALCAAYPKDTFYLIMGSDMFLTLTEWYRWERIFQLAVLCVGAREPHLREPLDSCRRDLERLGARCRLVELEPLLISSTDIRGRVRAGRDISELVPESVARYIARNGLYRQA